MKIDVIHTNRYVDKLETSRAVAWAGSQLLSKELFDSLSVTVLYENCEGFGYCDVFGDSYADFDIIVKKTLGKKNTLRTLFHEMVHVKQYATGELRTGIRMNRWQGQVMPLNQNYWDLPWEIEAFGREWCLYSKYMSHQNRMMTAYINGLAPWSNG